MGLASIHRTPGSPVAFAVTALLLFACFSAGAPAARAEPFRCNRVEALVEAPTPEMRETTCNAIGAAVNAWASCDVSTSEAITVRVVPSARHPQYGECLGYYDSRNQCLEVADPASYADLINEEDARRELAAETVFRGIVAHEFAHALVASESGEHAIRPADHEFIAAVFEMESYGETARARLLAADPVKPQGSRGLVNLGIYAMAPRVFANNAWQLFQSEQDGCALIRAILRGEASLATR